MTIKQSEVDSLRDGDVIELRDDRWPGDSVVRGPVVLSDYGFVVGPMLVATGLESLRMTVVARAPRPLYVNHPRTEPVPGDVVRDADSGDAKVWLHGRNYDDEPMWLDSWRVVNAITNKMPARLRLLVDGTTGQVVP